MVARYSPDQIDEYNLNREKWLDRTNDFFDTILSRKYLNEKAGMYAREGLSRRLGYLDHALVSLAEVYPPNLARPSRSRVRNAELLIQALIMNIFGAIDNLAWIWAFERGVTRKDGTALRPSEIVFTGSRANQLYLSLTPPVQAVINESSEWFEGIGAYRNGVAHQIPIYIPRLLTKYDYQQAEVMNRAIDAAMVEGDVEAVVSIMHDIEKLGDYGAMMALSADHPPIMLHPQLVCDLATVVNLGETIFAELNNQ